VAFDEVGFAGCDPGEVHLDKVLYGAALRHEAPEEGVEPCPQVQDLDSRVAGLKVPTNCRSGKARNKSMDPIPISQFFSKFYNYSAENSHSNINQIRPMLVFVSVYSFANPGTERGP
jgi:hypothetical protein